MIPYSSLLAFLTVVGITTVRHPAWILQTTSLCFILSACFVLLAFFPIGKVSLGPRSSGLSFLKYVIILILAQFALGMITLTVMLAFIGGDTHLASLLWVVKAIPKVSEQYHLNDLYFTVLPASLFGLWALIISYVYYIKDQYPLVGNALRLLFIPIFSKKLRKIEPFIKYLIEYTVFTASLCCLALSLNAALIVLSYFLEFQRGLPSHFKLPLISLMLLSWLGPLGIFIVRQKLLLKFLKWTKTYSLVSIVFISIILIIPIFIFSSFLGEYCLNNLSSQMAKIHGNCVYYFETIAIQNRIAALFWGWILLWVPLGGSFIASLSKGRTIRELILGISLSSVTVLLLSRVFIFNMPFKLAWFIGNASYISLILGMITLGIIIMILRKIKNTLFFYTGFMSLPTSFKTSRTSLRWAPKIKGLQTSFIIMILAILSGFYLLMLGGWSIIALQCLAIGTVIMLVLAMSMIGLFNNIFIKNFIKK